ncbi:type II toxin-antitoxin system PemK/MazF family toxin [Arthrobacter sp. USHLN218]|uniref:type II toxin-antitoxin system PemK/MazF family toxin n=1 Tax=Arthrobacter sp. USHLN218 TaxID=3081232 RepID=UPI00301A21BD
MPIDANTFGRLLRGAATVLRNLQRGTAAPPPTRGRGRQGQGARPETPNLSSSYPGDFRGAASVMYAPKPDGQPDPGEIVWTWVPYEEDHTQGKDRPVLLVGHSGGRLLALMMTTKDRNNGQHSDSDYVDVGTGRWDRQRRPSEVKLDRILQVDPADIRREGAVLDRAPFEQVAAELRRRYGWS